MNVQGIRDLIRKILKDKIASGKLEIPGPGEKELTEKFPSFEEVLQNLLTDQYQLFVQDVAWVAPKPTTFRVEFKNGEFIYLTKTERGWDCEVEGKKYDLEGLQGEQRATEAISRILRYGKSKSQDEGGSQESIDTETPIEEPAQETPPTEETPEETPPAEA